MQITKNAVLDFHIEIHNNQGQRLDNIIISRKIDGLELNVANINNGLFLPVKITGELKIL